MKDSKGRQLRLYDMVRILRPTRRLAVVVSVGTRLKLRLICGGQLVEAAEEDVELVGSYIVAASLFDRRET